MGETKKKPVAAVLALFLGYMGAHRFYLNQRSWGIAYLGFFFLLFFMVATGGPPLIVVPILVGFLDAVLLSVMPQEEFDLKFNTAYYDKQGYRDRPSNRPQRAYSAPARHQSIDRQHRMQRLKSEGIRYFRRHHYEAALDAFEEALEIAPHDPSLHFNIACCYSRLEELRPALEHLEAAFEYGFDRPEKLQTHPAFAWLRRQPAFRDFVANDYRIPPAQLPAPSKDRVSWFDEVEVEEEMIEEESPSQPEAMPEFDLLDQIAKLGELRERGILTDEEFSEQKRRLLR